MESGALFYAGTFRLSDLSSNTLLPKSHSCSIQAISEYEDQAVTVALKLWHPMTDAAEPLDTVFFDERGMNGSETVVQKLISTELASRPGHTENSPLRKIVACSPVDRHWAHTRASVVD